MSGWEAACLCFSGCSEGHLLAAVELRLEGLSGRYSMRLIVHSKVSSDRAHGGLLMPKS